MYFKVQFVCSTFKCLLYMVIALVILLYNLPQFTHSASLKTVQNFSLYTPPIYDIAFLNFFL